MENRSKVGQYSESDTPSIRLNKFIADAGVCSRRNAEEIILAGRIAINGRVVSDLSCKVDPKRDWVKLDGKRIQPKNVNEDLVYVFNKPKACVSTLFDPEGRETITKYIPKNFPRLFPVGRLDYDTEGLLLLTNAGYLANQIAHPRGEVWKTYLVKVKGTVNRKDTNEVREGMQLRGTHFLPAGMKILQMEGDKTWLELRLREGKNHQIKNMFFDLGYPVLKIKRVQIANIRLNDLKLGELRRLTMEEVRELKQSLGPAENAAKPLPRKRISRKTMPNITTRE